MADKLSKSDERLRPNWPASIIDEDAGRDGRTARALGDESTSEDATEIARRLRRGDEAFGDPNIRDFPSLRHDEEATGIRKGPYTRLDSRADLIGRMPIDTRLTGVEVHSRPALEKWASTASGPPV
ncbi:MAG: hypothetical protein DMF75_10525, partial [Acidobacteria bacterium]